MHESHLGENFRILLPLSNYEANYFNSRDQIVRKVDKTSTGVILHYGPLKNDREEVDVSVSYEIRDTGSQLNFKIQVDNRTDRPLAEVLYAILGGQQGIGERTETQSLIPSGNIGNLAPKLFSQYEPRGMPFGTAFNFAGFTYPGPSGLGMGWMDVYNSKAGIGYYYANHDSDIRLTALYTELHPYAKTLASKDNWPRREELPANEPIGLTTGWVSFPYTKRGVFRAGPVALQVHDGDWHNAAKLYRTWFDQHFSVSRPPNWLRQEMAWQSINLLTPVDEVVYRFKDLPRLAADAKKYGVTTFQIFGWYGGGQDKGRPDHTPDQRLGTRDEFKRALADIRAMGVHPILSANLQMADTSTEAYRMRWSRYTVQGRKAPDLFTWGFGTTVGDRIMQETSTHMTFISPSHTEFREHVISQYLDRVGDGGEGLQLDGAILSGYLDFNPNLKTSPDKSLPQGMQTTYQDFLSRARKINPNVALSLQDYYDRSFPFNDVSYGNANIQDIAPVMRYTFPEWTSVTISEQPGDFDLMNNALRYGYAWGLAPRGHTASMDEELTRPLSRYVAELIRIRKQYVDLLFLGRFNDTLGATVTGNPDVIRHAVFMPMDRRDARRACVVVNFGDTDEGVEVSIEGKEGKEARISIPFESERVATLPVKLMLPPHRPAVVIATN